MAKKKKPVTAAEMEEIRTKDFFDMIAPATIKLFYRSLHCR